MYYLFIIYRRYLSTAHSLVSLSVTSFLVYTMNTGDLKPKSLNDAPLFADR